MAGFRRILDFLMWNFPFCALQSANKHRSFPLIFTQGKRDLCQRNTFAVAKQDCAVTFFIH
ncbi:Uncharacterised protein [Shigella sonnei]|nr:Uncharacterised protein [Shigella sonnei]